MRDAWNILYVDFRILIPSLIIMALGLWLFANQKESIFRAISGAVLTTLGGLAVLTSFYLDDLRWINQVLSLLLVIFVGFILVRRAPGVFTTVLGVLAILIGLFALSNSRPLNQIDYPAGSFGQALSRGWDRFVSIMNYEEDAPRDRPEQDNRRGERPNQ